MSRPAVAWLHRLAVAAAVLVLLTIAVGAVVTSLDIGMAYATWPGYNDRGFLTAPFSVIYQEGGAGAVIEHSHRLVAAATGAVIAALAAAALLARGLPRAWRWIAAGALLLVAAQGIVGGLRVLENERGLALVHGVGAQIVLAALVALVKLTSAGSSAPGATEARDGSAQRLRMWSAAAAAVVFVQLFAGAGLRHGQASFAGHLFLAAVVAAVALATARLVFLHFPDHRRLVRTARQLVALLGLQLGLGLAVWIVKHGPLAAQTPLAIHAVLATGHVFAGALFTAAVASLVLEAWTPAPRGDPAPVSQRSLAEAAA